jgi:hypothetical protein|tara:strand:+ start:44 stop:478 length:435 start_codon:yes stop_codon:yes gene_type:complete
MKINNVFLLFAIFLIACNEDNAQVSQTDFETNLTKWEELDISDYYFTQSISCYCTEEYLLPKEVRVVNATIVSINGEIYNPEVHYDFRKINDFFDFIEGKANSNPSSFEVNYDKQHGFPTLIVLDPVGQIADDEITYRLSDFKY